MTEKNKEATAVIENAITNAGKKIFNHIVTTIFIGWLVIAALGYLLSGGYEKDATDGYKRSNLKLRTDYGTGCQYLETTGGSITPRLGYGGVHVGCDENKNGGL